VLIGLLWIPTGVAWLLTAGGLSLIEPLRRTADALRRKIGA
jgi:hypothetical protein